MEKRTKYQSAVHESGHAFTYIYVGHTFKTVDIRVSKTQGRLGRIAGGRPIITPIDLDNFIQENLPNDEDIRIGNIIVNLLMIHLAGYESEKIFEVYDPNIDDELKSDDYSKAYDLALAMATRKSSSDANIVLCNSRIALNKILINNKSIIEKFASELMRKNEVCFELLNEIYAPNKRCS